jgi:hypothetical protein
MMTRHAGHRPAADEDRPGQEVIAGTTVVHVLDLGKATQAHSLNEVSASNRLNIEAEHLPAFVIL